MKISVNIEDATPEEFTRLFGGLQTECPVRVAVSNNKGGRIQNLNAPPWTDDERATISSCKDGLEAVKAYREKYPLSTRTPKAVRRMWLVVRDKPAPSPAIVAAPPSPKEVVPVVERKERKSTNPYGIPSSLATTDKKTYQRLWYRCKSQGIRYEEALAQEGVMKRGKRPDKPAASQPAPEKKQRKSPVTKERLPFHQTQTGSAASSGTNPQIITSGMPASQTIYQSNAPSLHGLQLKSGDRVRHNGSKASPHFGKEGQILKVNDDGSVFVKFGEASTWLSPHLVAVVPGASAS